MTSVKTREVRCVVVAEIRRDVLELAVGLGQKARPEQILSRVAYSFIVRPTSSRNTWARRSTDSPTELATSDSAIVSR